MDDLRPQFGLQRQRHASTAPVGRGRDGVARRPRPPLLVRDASASAQPRPRPLCVPVCVRRLRPRPLPNPVGYRRRCVTARPPRSFEALSVPRERFRPERFRRCIHSTARGSSGGPSLAAAASPQSVPAHTAGRDDSGRAAVRHIVLATTATSGRNAVPLTTAFARCRRGRRGARGCACRRRGGGPDTRRPRAGRGGRGASRRGRRRGRGSS